jgi:2-polyprenyl-3-methyl-5-hydroxy-6-metoxy-1,4-benzoquinol methylase
MTDKIKRCKICDSSHTVVERLGGKEFVFCESCNVTFLADPPLREELASYYESNYQITAQDYIATEKRRIFRFPEQIKLIATLAQMKPPPASVLDIGCDKGYFLDEMRRYGYAVMGVELSSAARLYCKNIGIEAKQSTDELKEAYDIITMWHTLEHIGDPVGFLKQLCNHLAAAGLVAIRVPDYGCLWRKIFREKWIWFQPQNHYFHYTENALRQLLQVAGLEVIQIQSQRPNNGLTDKAYRLAARTFGKYWNDGISLKKKMGKIYEDVTGIELYALAIKK